MSTSIEYNGYVIEPTTRVKGKPDCWTLEVRITPTDDSTGVRRCRAPNTYSSKAVAVERCLEFGRRIIDGKARLKVDPAT
jgi:hypothetical protein